MTLDNVNIFHGALVATGKKVPIAQYELEVMVEGDTVVADRKEKKSKQQRVLFPDILELLSAAELEEVIRDILIRYARNDTEKTIAKEN